MADSVNRHCPQCGRKAHDRLLMQCPDCHVPFVADDAPDPAVLTSEQLKFIAVQIFGSWKFWAAFVLVVGVAAWAIVIVADKMIDARAKTYLSTLGQQATNNIGAAFGQISNQIVAEFKQPRIKAAIEQTARDRASEILTNRVAPSLEAFLDAMDVANAQLAKSTNLIAQLERDARDARRRIPPPTPVIAYAPTNPITPSSPAPAATPATTPTPAASASPATANSGPKLTLINSMVNQAGTGYTLTLFFRAKDPSVTGNVGVQAGTYRQTAQILNFASMTSAPTAPAQFTDTREAAQLNFNVSPNESPTLVLEVSAPTIIRLMSDAFDNDLTLPVAADKMQLPSANK